MSDTTDSRPKVGVVEVESVSIAVLKSCTSERIIRPLENRGEVESAFRLVYSTGNSIWNKGKMQKIRVRPTWEIHGDMRTRAHLCNYVTFLC
jgi:hypothetical protein